MPTFHLLPSDGSRRRREDRQHPTHLATGNAMEDYFCDMWEEAGVLIT